MIFTLTTNPYTIISIKLSKSFELDSYLFYNNQSIIYKHTKEFVYLFKFNNFFNYATLPNGI